MTEVDVYACGNPSMIAAARTEFTEKAGLPEARFYADAMVTAIARDGTRFVLETSKGSFSAGQVVVAAGAWTASIGRMVGLNLPVTGSIGQVRIVLFHRLKIPSDR